MLGNIPLPAYIAVADYIKVADEEFDSQIGYVYETPLDVSENGPMSRPARLLINRISKLLATARILMAIAAPDEKNAVNAYAWQLLREAKAALGNIVNGEFELEGALLVRRPAVDQPTKGPIISNVDSESNVEAFYDRIANPNYTYPPVSPRYVDPDRLIG
jgi:hypothetical protein